jgi:Tfp pilus assembly protein PilE
MKKFFKKLKKVDGQSLAEFAVTTDMMATLATTAAPKFSGVGEGAKEKKTMADMDKIMKSANNFYNEQVTSAGRGRFPGQEKYNEPCPTNGGYTYSGTAQSSAEDEVILALKGDGDTDPTFIGYKSTIGENKWASVFGTAAPNAAAPSGFTNSVSTVENPDQDYYDNGLVTPAIGAEEFLDNFGGEAIKSPFQDGHYIYTVIAGGGSGSASYAPILYIADLESPSSFHRKLQP